MELDKLLVYLESVKDTKGGFSMGVSSQDIGGISYVVLDIAYMDESVSNPRPEVTRIIDYGDGRGFGLFQKLYEYNERKKSGIIFKNKITLEKLLDILGLYVKFDVDKIEKDIKKNNQFTLQWYLCTSRFLYYS